MDYQIEYLGRGLVHLHGIGNIKKGLKIIISDKTALRMKTDKRFRVTKLNNIIKPKKTKEA